MNDWCALQNALWIKNPTSHIHLSHLCSNCCQSPVNGAACQSWMLHNSFLQRRFLDICMTGPVWNALIWPNDFVERNDATQDPEVRWVTHVWCQRATWKQHQNQNDWIMIPGTERLIQSSITVMRDYKTSKPLWLGSLKEWQQMLDNFSSWL